ncbi:TPA: type I toxin-antitoxin system Ibs family toxin, partial [Escherichia coli]|nr:type I toxin-antitoxin system Ibs family toxin [Escherichia coli]EFE6755696.1 type I toxin-antitoxin system Ibs family toxin [Escherichia coli]EFN0924126.1 type I toxin-antitoxin system Ibs family toxin [Escherichia coli]EFS5657857.1 type I toxin-antitoxin system Ibs family toxin [Escherichia coli]EGL1966509.1 type I toxin-antitoxin system Ibs family toxin [Escherichia coli]
LIIVVLLVISFPAY